MCLLYQRPWSVPCLCMSSFSSTFWWGYQLLGVVCGSMVSWWAINMVYRLIWKFLYMIMFWLIDTLYKIRMDFQHSVLKIVHNCNIIFCPQIRLLCIMHCKLYVNWDLSDQTEWQFFMCGNIRLECSMVKLSIPMISCTHAQSHLCFSLCLLQHIKCLLMIH